MVVSCWLSLYDLYYVTRNHEHQVKKFSSQNFRQMEIELYFSESSVEGHELCFQNFFLTSVWRVVLFTGDKNATSYVRWRIKLQSKI